jgi:DNA-binding MarR family transcriptional regulator
MSAPSTQDTPPRARQLLEAIYLTMRRLRRESFSKAGLGQPDLMILGSLRKMPGRGVSDLAAEGGVSGPTMSAQIKRLEASGLIMREPTLDGDRRRVSLTLSPRAEAMMDTMLSESSDWMAARLAELTEEEREAIFKALGPLGKIAGVQPPQG